MAKRLPSKPGETGATPGIGQAMRLLVEAAFSGARFWLPLLDQRDDAYALPSFVRTLTAELDRHAVAADRRALAQLLDRL